MNCDAPHPYTFATGEITYPQSFQASRAMASSVVEISSEAIRQQDAGSLAEMMPCMMFLDNSNFFSEGQKWMAHYYGLTCLSDQRFRLNMEGLAMKLIHGRPIVDIHVYGSNKLDSDATERVWAAFREAGAQTHVLPRSTFTGRERQVDGSLVADLMKMVRRADREYVGCAIVGSGDEDALGACKNVLEKTRWSVEVWSVKSGLSSKFAQLQKLYPTRLHISPLDGMFADALQHEDGSAACYVKRQWNDCKSANQSNTFLVRGVPNHGISELVDAVSRAAQYPATASNNGLPRGVIAISILQCVKASALTDAMHKGKLAASQFGQIA